jgi:hypothetical protein
LRQVKLRTTFTSFTLSLESSNTRQSDASKKIWDAECRGKIEGLAKQGVPTDLPNALFRCTKAFERLRYAYEDQFRDVTFYIGDFPWILARVISEIKPEWAPSEPPPMPGFKSPG